jgi:hypothetical protein
MPWRLTDDGLIMRVRLTPKAARDAIEGVEGTADGPAIKARVRAVPADGKANAALEALIAGWLGVAKGNVQVSAGAKSRVKNVAILGRPAELAARVQARLAEPGAA